MDILLTAILGALSKLSDTAVRDCYQALKATIHKKFGAQGSLAGAVEAIEDKPESSARRQVLEEEIGECEASADDELLNAASAVVDALRNLPDGASIVQKIQVTLNVGGKGNVVAGIGDINIGTAREDR